MATLRKWSVMLITAFVTAAVLIAATAVFVGTPEDRGAQASTAAASPAPPAAAATPSNVGPEGVPLTRGAPLGPARSPLPGRASGGVPCGSREQLRYHVHARLTLFVDGKSRAVPLGIGIAPPRTITQSRNGPFVSGGGCFSFLHTHATDGVIHIEAPGRVAFTLGQFFNVWQQPLDRRHLGSIRGHVVAYVDGRRFRGDPRTIPLHKHTQIQLQIHSPGVKPKTISFPAGL